MCITFLGRPSCVVARGACMDINLSVLFPTIDCTVLCSKTGRREVPGSVPGRACQPNCLEFSAVFSETHVNNGLGSLRKTPTEGIPPIGLDP